MDFTRIFDFVGDIPASAKYVAALIFVLILILLVSVVLKKIMARVRTGGRDGGRLKVGESIMIDSSRTLTLVSCDNVEHLILLGGTNDLVVAANLQDSHPTDINVDYTDDEDQTVYVAPSQPPAAAPAQAPRQTTPVVSRAIAPPEPESPAHPEHAQPSHYRRSRKAPVQPLAKPAPRPRPTAVPSRPTRYDPDARSQPARPQRPVRSEAGPLNGEEGGVSEETTSSSFSEIRPGDEK